MMVDRERMGKRGGYRDADEGGEARKTRGFIDVDSRMVLRSSNFHFLMYFLSPDFTFPFPSGPRAGGRGF